MLSPWGASHIPSIELSLAVAFEWPSTKLISESLPEFCGLWALAAGIMAPIKKKCNQKIKSGHRILFRKLVNILKYLFIKIIFLKKLFPKHLIKLQIHTI